MAASRMRDQLPGWLMPRTALLSALLWVLAAAAFAEGITIKSAELIPNEGGYILEARYDVDLSPTLEEALVRGLTLTFIAQFELVYPRWWTLNIWNKELAGREAMYRLSYNALTRQYRLSLGGFHQTFHGVEQALAVLGRVRFNPAVKEDQIEPGTVYIAGVRLRLDTGKLPKPLQLDAIGSRDWNLASDWYRWTFTP
ncbi:MAG: DUF4390 domain-containing protein [Burkholderiales bacterium]|nr:DUF4390 domain-containing protein [Burkholderiales bacterium]